MRAVDAKGLITELAIKMERIKLAANNGEQTEFMFADGPIRCHWCQYPYPYVQRSKESCVVHLTCKYTLLERCATSSSFHTSYLSQTALSGNGKVIALLLSCQTWARRMTWGNHMHPIPVSATLATMRY
jgi:hypothetical protein